IVEYFLTKVGLEKEFEMFNIDRIATGISKSQKDKMVILTEIIRDICRESGSSASVEEIVARAVEYGMDRETVESLIAKMRREGIIYEPKNGRYRVTNE
ncbi:MAG: Minichromosome maintenance protein MCM, partial [Candidatus Thermoplasmatota archaeon]